MARQDNETLALRTKLEWTVPPLIQADKFVRETAKIYIKGDKEHKLKSRQWPIIGDGKSSKSYKVSKVISSNVLIVWKNLIHTADHPVGTRRKLIGTRRLMS